MVICVKLGTALTNGGLIAFDFANLSTNEKLLYISVQNMITPIVIAGLVKTADSVIGRFLQEVVKIMASIVHRNDCLLVVHYERDKISGKNKQKQELMEKNPTLHATVPKAVPQKREVWDAETIFLALDVCDDARLKLAINLSFACSMRIGEILGLTWDCVDISP